MGKTELISKVTKDYELISSLLIALEDADACAVPPLSLAKGIKVYAGAARRRSPRVRVYS